MNEASLFDQPRRCAAEGERRALMGMMSAAARAGDLVPRAQLQAIEAAMARVDLAFTSDDITAGETGTRRELGGRWMGSAIKSLAMSGLTRAGEYQVSARPSRHGGTVRRWYLVDVAKAQRFAEQLRRQLGLSGAGGAIG